MSERRGGWGAAGSRVFSNENFQSEILTPLAACIALMVIGAAGIGLIVIDSFILGPGLWAIIGIIIIAALGVLGAMAIHSWDWWWILFPVAATVAALVFWLLFGIDWLRAIWPRSAFSKWFYNWPTWWKVPAQLVIGLSLAALRWAFIRLRVEILDPGWSRRFERDAAIVGAKPNLPHRGEQFPAQELQRQIEDLEADLEEAQINRRRVTLEVTNGDQKTIGRADLPDDNGARAFYRVVMETGKFSTQNAIDCHIRTEYENEIRPAFLERKWAYKLKPAQKNSPLRLRGDGWKAIAKLAALPHSE